MAHAANNVRNHDPIQPWYAGHKQPFDPRPIITHYKLLTIKNNPYNSKPMTIFLHGMLYHVIQCNLVFTVFYMQAFIISSLIIFSLITQFHAIGFIVIKMTFHVNCKHACFDIENISAMRKTNNKYPCEFYSP